MNLHSIVAPYISVVNPMLLVVIQKSAGWTTTDSAKRIAVYETPGTFTGQISGDVMDVFAVAQGVLAPGQLLIDANSLILPGTSILSQISGTPGGIGSYRLSQAQPADIQSGAISTFLATLGQLQPLSTNDLRQIEGLNLQGTKKALYCNGELNAGQRIGMKGGDLVSFPDRSVWLVSNEPEPWSLTAGWTKTILTLQNELSVGPIGGLPSLDFSKPSNSMYLPGLL